MNDDLELNAQLFRSASHGDPQGLARAIELGANPQFMESLALSEAASNGHAECVKILIPLSRPWELYARPLRHAAYNGHADCVRLLIPSSSIIPEQSLALQLAALGGHAGCVGALLPHVDPLARNCEALLWAAGKGHAPCVEMLLSAAEPWPRPPPAAMFCARRFWLRLPTLGQTTPKAFSKRPRRGTLRLWPFFLTSVPGASAFAILIKSAPRRAPCRATAPRRY